MSGINLPVLTGDTSSDQTAIRKALLALTGTSSGSSSSGTVIEPLSTKISHSVSYSITDGQGIYTIYIPAAYLVAASGGPYTLTIKTSASGDVVYVPIVKYGDTILSGNILFDVYVDASGNTTSAAFTVSGSNSAGSWVKFADGTMDCMIAYTATGGYANDSLTSPATFLFDGFYGLTGNKIAIGWSQVPSVGTGIGCVWMQSNGSSVISRMQYGQSTYIFIRGRWHV